MDSIWVSLSTGRAYRDRAEKSRFKSSRIAIWAHYLRHWPHIEPDWSWHHQVDIPRARYAISMNKSTWVSSMTLFVYTKQYLSPIHVFDRLSEGYNSRRDKHSCKHVIWIIVWRIRISRLMTRWDLHSYGSIWLVENGWTKYSTHCSMHALVTDRVRRIQFAQKRVCLLKYRILQVYTQLNKFILHFAPTLMRPCSPLYLRPNCVSIRGCISLHLWAIHLTVVEFLVRISIVSNGRRGRKNGGMERSPTAMERN